MTITSGSGGNGAGAVLFNVAANSGAPRTAAINVANQQFTITELANATNTNVTLQFVNYLIYPVNVSANGAFIGSINGSSSVSMTIAASSALQVSFELVRPTVAGRPVGDPMTGFYDTINNPSGSYRFTINNQIGSQVYFAPLITNHSPESLLMDVNGGLASENRCNCDVRAGGVNVGFGYYLFFSDSNVRAFQAGSGCTGAYYYSDNLSSFVESQTGVAR